MTTAVAEVTREFEKLKAITESLANRAAKLGDKETLRLLDRVWHRLEQGPVRLLVLGLTSAGKSTLINALAGDVVVPEGNTATSPLPVWLKQGNVNLDLFNRDADAFPEREPMGLFAFITQFCYSALDNDSSRYANYSAAECCRETLHPDLAGVTVIDTPGLKASSGDDARAQECAELGCEMVLFLCSAENGTGALSDGDGKYYRDLFEELKLDMPNSLFVVGNVRDEVYSGLGAEAGFERVARLHFGKYIRLFRFDVRAARIKRAGPYRYGDLLPEQVKNDEERDNAGVRQAAEMALYREAQGAGDDFWITDYDDAIVQLDKLCAAIHQRTQEILANPQELIQPVREQLKQAAVRLLQQDVDDPSLTEEDSAIRQLATLSALMKSEQEENKKQLDSYIRAAQYSKDTGTAEMLKQLHSRSDFYRVFDDDSISSADAIMVASLRKDNWAVLHHHYTRRYRVYTAGKHESLFCVDSPAYNLHDNIRKCLTKMHNQLANYAERYSELTVSGADPEVFDTLITAVREELQKLRVSDDYAFDNAKLSALEAFDPAAFDRLIAAELVARREALVQRRWGSKFFLYSNVEGVGLTCYRAQVTSAARCLNQQYYTVMIPLLESKPLCNALLKLQEHVDQLTSATHKQLISARYSQLFDENITLA